MESNSDTETETGLRSVGHDNVQKYGLDIQPQVFLMSAIMIVTIVVGTLLFQDTAAILFGDMRSWITEKFDWFYMIVANLFVFYCIYVAYSKFGRVRLGGPDAKPHYGYPAWLAMLFAAGVGIGLMFFGVLEPVTHTVNTPLGVDPADTATASAVGMSAAIFHWGLHAWAVYAVVGLSLAFFALTAARRSRCAPHSIHWSASTPGAGSATSLISPQSLRRCLVLPFRSGSVRNRSRADSTISSARRSTTPRRC